MNALNLNHGPLNSSYLNRIVDVIHCSLFEHPRTMAIRIDLRLPDIADLIAAWMSIHLLTL